MSNIVPDTNGPIGIIAGNFTLGAQQRVAYALKLLIPNPESESIYRATARAMLQHHSEIESFSQGMKEGQYQTAGMLKDAPNALAVMLITVAESKLLPRISGVEARRHLAALVVERVLQAPEVLSDPSIVLHSRLVRMELEDLRLDAASRPVMDNPKSLLDLMTRMNKLIGTRYGHQYVKLWETRIRPFAYSLLTLKPSSDEDETTDTDLEVDIYIEVPTGPGSEDDFIRGLIPPENEGVLRRTPGALREIYESKLSTNTNIRLLSCNSTTILTDAEVRGEIANSLANIKNYYKDHATQQLESELGRLLVLATGTAQGQISNLMWINPDLRIPSPAGISLDGKWLIRPDIGPSYENNQNNDGYRNRGAWILLPPKISSWLMKLNPAPESYTFVFPKIQDTNMLNNNPELNSFTALRRTFFSRVAQLEPIGISGAQWATGDSFGLNEAPLYYDSIHADKLASLIRQITFPWFGDKPFDLSYRPKHLLGSRVSNVASEIKKIYVEKYKKISNESGLNALINHINQLTWNIVHGLVATTGHRPNDNFVKLTLNQFDIHDNICVLSDKAVSPDWLHRPAALAKPVSIEIASLVQALKKVSTIVPGTELGNCALAAAKGVGPLFLKIVSVDEVLAFDRSDYLEGVPANISKNKNFARHYLNQYLIGRVPEALRVGQLGWHGSREGAWSIVSPWSVKSASQDLQKNLLDLLKTIGWKQIGNTSKITNFFDIYAVDWIDIEKKHGQEFRSHVYSLQKNERDRQKKTIEKMLPNIKDVIKYQFPRLRVDEKYQIQWRDESDSTQIPVKVNSHDFNNILNVLGDNASKYELLVIRNLLSVIFRSARKRNIVEGKILQRCYFGVKQEQGFFLPEAPLALRICHDLKSWLMSSNNSLSLTSWTLIGLLIYGGYPDINLLFSAMQKSTKLVRCNAYQHCLLAQTGDSQKTLAFHGIAALILMRWHRDRHIIKVEIEQLYGEVYAALPEDLKSCNPGMIFEHLMALVRIRNSLEMDGIARLVGTGRVSLTTVGASRIIAAQDNHPVEQKFEVGRTATSRPVNIINEKRIKKNNEFSSRDLTSLLAKYSGMIGANEISESKAKASVRSTLAVQLENHTNNPTMAQLLIRYCIGLIDEGGDRILDLRFSTIKNYVETISSPLENLLGESPLGLPYDAWQESFIQILESTSVTYRVQKLEALERFYDVLSSFITLPAVDFGALIDFAGKKVTFVSPGFLTERESEEIAIRLNNDVSQLDNTSASIDELLLAKSHEVYYLSQSTTCLRTGEGTALALNDICISDSNASVMVRRHGSQQLKTINARRRMFLQGNLKSIAIEKIGQWIDAARSVSKSSNSSYQSLYGQIFNSNNDHQDRLKSRVNDMIRWATNNSSADIYWTRKTDIRRNVFEYQKQEVKSLWPIRDILVRAGQADIRTTMTNYMHDPFVVFHRWFLQQESTIPIDYICRASNRSKSLVRRRYADTIKYGQRQDEFQSRVSHLLANVPVQEIIEVELTLPPKLITNSSFNVTVHDLDKLFRCATDIGGLQVAAHYYSWPSKPLEILLRLLTVLENDYSVGFKGISNNNVLIVKPPRLIRAISDNGPDVMSQFIKVEDSEIILEMAQSMLISAAHNGFSNGIPGQCSSWVRWANKIQISDQWRWTIYSQRAMEFRRPEKIVGFKNRTMPMIRWQLILTWLAAEINHGLKIVHP